MKNFAKFVGYGDMQKFTRFPVDTRRKLNVHKTFRRRPGRLLNVLCTFNLRPVSTGLQRIRKIAFTENFSEQSS